MKRRGEEGRGEKKSNRKLVTAVMTAAMIVFSLMPAFVPMAAAATVTAFNITPTTGTAGATVAYNVSVNATAWNTLNITIPAGFEAVAPTTGNQLLAKVEFYGSDGAWCGNITIESYSGAPSDKVAITGYNKSGKQAGASVIADMNYNLGATTEFVPDELSKLFPTWNASVNLTLPTETKNGSLNISLPSGKQLTNVTVSLGTFVKNPTKAGTYTFVADSQTATVTINPDAPSKWYIGTPSGNTTVGKSIPITVNVTDQYGNINNTFSESYNGSVSLTVTEGTATASISPDATVKLNSTNRNTTKMVNVSAAPAKVKVEVWGGGLTAAEEVLEYYTGVTSIAFTLVKTELYANNTDTTTLTAQLKDASDNDIKVQGVPITVSEYTTLGLKFNGLDMVTAKTDSDGKATFTVKAGTKAGTATIRANIKSGDFAGTSGETSLTLKQAPNAANTGGTVYPAAISTITAGVGKVITATLKDYNASAIKDAADFPIKFNITDGDAKWTENGLKVYEDTSDSNGNVSATLYSTNASAANKINVTISVKNETGGWEEVKSFTGITVAPNNATKFKITPAPPVALPTSKGAHQNFTVQLIDDYGNDNKTAGIDIIVTNNKPEYGNMTNGTFYNEQIVTTTGAGGNASFTYYVNVSGVVYTANLDLNASELNITDTITITTSGPDGVDIKANKTNPLVGDSVLLTINITDAEGNRLSLQGVPITLTTTGGTLGDYALISDANGQNSTTLTSTEPGPITVTAYAAGYSDSETVIFSGNATTFVITPEKASLSVGETCNLTIQAKDANGYNTSMYNGKSIAGQTINFIVSPTGATLGTTSTTFDSTGKATNNITSATANTYTITGAGIGTTNTTTVTFTPVEVKNFSVSITPSNITVNESTSVTVTVTDADTEEAVEGATVNLSGCGVTLSDTTNATGIATFEVNASETGNITVTVSKEGYNTKEETITVTPVDWNPWDDDGVVTTEEIQEAVNYWVTDTPINGHLITTPEIQELVNMWLTT